MKAVVDLVLSFVLGLTLISVLGYSVYRAAVELSGVFS